MKLNVTPRFWQLSLSGLALVAMSLYSDRAFAAGFTGGYAPSNFTFTNTNADGSIDITNAANGTVILIGGDNGNENPGTTDWTIAINPSRVGTWSFNWSYASLDTEGNDTAGYLINGTLNPLTSKDGDSSPFPVTFNVVNGDVVGFRVATVNNFGGAGEFTVNNFQVTAVPFEFSPALGLVGLGTFGVFKLMRKSPKLKK